MKVLITGGNGFIGSHLAERLIEQGDSVTLFDLIFNSNTSEINCKKIRGDIKDYDSIKKAVQGKEAVFHFAAVSRVLWGEQDPLNCWQTNSTGTVNVLEACRKAKSKPSIFFASSREVYGEPEYIPVDEKHPKNPKSVYGTTKLSAEHACFSYHKTFGIDVVVFRFSNVYGSERDQLERVIPKFMIKALRGENITLNGGDQILDFTFVDDTVSGIISSCNAKFNGVSNVNGEDFQFVTGRGVSVAELSKKIVELADSPSTITRIQAKNFDVTKFIGDPSKSYKILDYSPKIRLEEGLKILSERISAKIDFLKLSNEL
jgi:UDP-glucose 4-epimerase